MTTAPRRTQTISAPIGEGALDSLMRQKGRAFIIMMYSALRATKLYPVGHATVQRALEDLTTLTREMIVADDELAIRVAGEFIFIDDARLRLDLDNYAAFSHLLSVFRAAAIGTLHVGTQVTARDWQVLLSLVQSGDLPPDERFHHLVDKLLAAGITAFRLSEPTEEGSEDRERSKERAKRTYAQSIAVTKDLMTSVRMGKSPSIKKIKRVVQTIVDQILNDEVSLLGLTTIRDYDEYTFTHSVNVCIFAVALGRRLGLAKLQLYDLGMAALFHDIGKSRVPLEVLNKTSGLTDEEWRQVADHPWLGVLSLFQIRGAQEYPYRSMIVAMEHHMKADLTGYPRPIRPRQLSIFSKIVAVADGFDAATSRRSYQSRPYTPADVMKELRDNPRRGMDPVVVKAFVNLTGIYPLGTVVLLDTFELGIVHAVNPLPEMLSRPIVRVVSDAMGNLQHPGALVDLAEHAPNGGFARTIIKTENPERFGLRVSDYFV